MFTDAHCHIGTDVDPSRINELVTKYSKDDSLKLILMSSNHIDYKYVDKFGELGNVTPSFGVHPWYSHIFTFEETPVDKKQHYESVFQKEVDEEFLKILPDPINFQTHLNVLQKLIKKYQVCVIGEIGLDKLFRIPTSGFYSNPEFKGKDIKLTNYKTSMDHQKKIFIEQLKLGVELNLPISLHNVKSGGVIYEIISRYCLTDDYIGSICLHSYTGSIETLELFIKSFKKRKCKIFVSLSSYINNNEGKNDFLEKILEVLPNDAVLTETDLTLDNQEPVRYLTDIRDAIARIKQLDIVETDELILGNYKLFLNI